ncbi:MAG: hypothetical protein IT475_13800 [Aquimonas sp.]|nr:hypothetical protein [Aquimonas sp.]
MNDQQLNSDPISVATRLAARFSSIVGLFLLAYTVVWAVFSWYQYRSKYEQLVGHFSEATAEYLSIVIVAVILVLPFSALLRIFARQGRPRDVRIVLVMPTLNWATAMIPASFGNGPKALLDNPTEQVFFVQGRPVVWFSDTDKPCPTAWDRPGFHPQTNMELVPATPPLVARYVDCYRRELSRQKQVQQEERERMLRQQEQQALELARQEAQARRDREAAAERQRNEQLAAEQRRNEQRAAERAAVEKARVERMEQRKLEETIAAARRAHERSQPTQANELRTRALHNRLFLANRAELRVDNNDCVTHDLFVNGDRRGRVFSAGYRTFTVPAGRVAIHFCERGGSRTCSTPRSYELPERTTNTIEIKPAHCQAGR